MDCAKIYKKVARRGETVDLFIDLFYMAMHGQRSELAFPATVSGSFLHGIVWEGMTRGTGGGITRYATTAWKFRRESGVLVWALTCGLKMGVINEQWFTGCRVAEGTL